MDAVSASHRTSQELEKRFELLTEISSKVQRLNPGSFNPYADLSHQIDNVKPEKREGLLNRLDAAIERQRRTLTRLEHQAARLKRQSSLTHRRSRPLDGTC